jgi:diguanylate cyclase (GGDEF)-like protein/PAS domain S-box-containing protein
LKIRNKIAITLLPIVMASVIVANIIFGLFFQRSIRNQEQNQISSARVNIASFINEQSKYYNGVVYHWGHSDDTYVFVDDRNSDYIDINQSESAYYNLGVSFNIILDSDGALVYKQYYSVDDEKFTNFPDGFFDSFEAVSGYSDFSGDVFGIFELADRFYFISTTFVTDTEDLKPANGRLFIGRHIDDSIVKKMEEISGCRLVSIETPGGPAIRSNTEAVVISDSTLNSTQDAWLIDVVYTQSYGMKSSVKLTLSMPRDRFLAELSEMRLFSYLNTAGSLVVSLILFLILSRYLSKPISALITDIKSINMAEDKFVQLPVKGRSEFTFLRQSMNLLLERIEIDQKKLSDGKEELYATLVSVGDGVIVVNKNERVRFMNPVAAALTGWDPQAAAGQPMDVIFHIIDEATRTPVPNPVKRVFETDSIVTQADHIILISKDGVERSVEGTAAPIKDTAGVTNGCVLIFKDISEKNEINRQIEYLSFHDQLTGLYNRRFFENELKKLDIQENLPLSIIYADVNGLKIINDAFGHESGDKIIQQFADLFNAVFRPGDVVARVGGDEFVALLPRTEEPVVAQIVERLREKTDHVYYMDIELSSSFGWDTKRDITQPISDVLRNAEDTMYQKKMLSSTSRRNTIIRSVLHTLNMKSPREEAHSIRVSSICESIGRALNLNNDDIKELVAAGELHDIGKIAIDEAILNKPEGLTKSEWSQMQHHPEIGFRLLVATNEFSNIAEFILEHHEKWDGTGYPKGLKGTEIHLKARIIAIADAYDAMTCSRPYRQALNTDAAAEEIKRHAGTQFDPDIARVFIERVLKLEW